MSKELHRKVNWLKGAVWKHLNIKQKRRKNNGTENECVPIT